MDVEERDDRIRLSFEIPGVDRDDVSVTVENGVLTVSGEKKSERETSEGVDGSRVVERRYGRFERSLALPQSVDPDRVSGRYENGVLVLDLPKSAESRRRTIEIGAGKEQQSLESGDRGSRKVA